MNPNRRVNPYRQDILNFLTNRTSNEVSWAVPSVFDGADGRRKYAIMLHGVCSYFRSRHPELKVNVHYNETNSVIVKFQQVRPAEVHASVSQGT